MRQTVYIVYDDTSESVAKRICNNIGINRSFFSPGHEITKDILSAMAKSCMVENFYVIKAEQAIIFPSFNFNFKPEPWDAMYMHTWNNDMSVRLYNKHSVMGNIDSYTDAALEDGLVQLKNIDSKISSIQLFDIVFISYDEPLADISFNGLLEQYPCAKRVDGVKGIFNAHHRAAKLADTHMFYVVDADAELLPSFRFDFIPDAYNRDSVHVWQSQNPVNDLIYGYGGVKLFPTQMLIDYSGDPVDFTTSVSDKFNLMPEVSNITAFNTDPFSAWRSGFRECTKLSSKVVHNQDSIETDARLDAWCTLGADRLFGEFTIAGAIAGRSFGTLHKNQPDMLGLINDFEWLKKQFNN